MGGRSTDEADRGNCILICGSGDAAGPCPSLGLPDDAEGLDVLCVTFDGAVHDRLDAMRAWGLPIERTGVVAVGTAVDVSEPSDRAVELPVVEDVDQMSDLGTNVRDTLQSWADDDVPSAMCFDSVTALLEVVDLDLAFEFLLVLTESIRPTGVTAHFHFDPSVADDESRRTIEHLFDHVVEAGGHG